MSNLRETPTASPPQEFMTTRDVAEVMGCSATKVVRMARAGKLPVAGKLRGIRGAYLFRAEDVLAQAAPQ